MITKDWKKTAKNLWKSGNKKVQVTGLDVKVPYHVVLEFKTRSL